MKPCKDHGQKGNKQGYGITGHKRLHRVVFQRTYGYLPPVVMHSCDNPRCIEPEHLQPGTQKMNNADRAAKGRSAKHRPAQRRLEPEQVLAIRTRYVPRYSRTDGVAALCREFGVTANCIYAIVQRRTYTDV